MTFYKVADSCIFQSRDYAIVFCKYTVFRRYFRCSIKADADWQ